jgi:flavin reductase (DIM6/NTAB) family NADH-FMN oxidoreductase RutF
VDEFELSGLTKAPSSLPRGTPRVAEALVAMECTVTKTEDLVGRSGEVTATMVYCSVDLFKLHPAVVGFIICLVRALCNIHFKRIGCSPSISLAHPVDNCITTTLR